MQIIRFSATTDQFFVKYKMYLFSYSLPFHILTKCNYDRGDLYLLWLIACLTPALLKTQLIPKATQKEENLRKRPSLIV